MKLRSYLVLLVGVAVLPVVIFAGVMTYRSYAQQQQELAQRMIESARAISTALDREFLVSIQSLKVLGASTNLNKGNLAEFYLDMKGALAAYSRAWQNLTLTDSSGRQLINLRRPFGAPLPISGNPEAIKRVRQTKEALVADLSPGPVTGAPGIVVHVPVLQDGEVKYVLNAIFYPQPLTELLLQQKLPPSWFATIIDRNQVIAARTRNFAKFFGKPEAPRFAAQAKQYQESTWRGVTLDAEDVFAALHRSDFSGWTIGLAAPAREFDALLRDSLLVTSAGGLALLLAALTLAVWFGRRIATSVSALSRDAEKVGLGETPPAIPSLIVEVDQVGRALEAAGKKRHAAETALHKSEAILAAAEARAKLGSWEVDLRMQTVWWSAEMFRLFDRYPARSAPTPEEFLDMVHPDDRRGIEEAQARAIETSDDCGVEFRSDRRSASERHFSAILRATKDPDGRVLQVAGTVQDVTERKKNEDRIAQLSRVYSVLSGINQAIVRIRDPQTLLSSACRIAVEKGEFRMAWIGQVNPATGMIEPSAYAGVNEGYVEKLDIVLSDPSRRAGPTSIALREGVHVVCNNIETDPRMAPWRDEALRRGYRSCAAFPLRIGNEVTGTLNLYSSERDFFSAQELSLLDELVADIGLALEIHRNESAKLRAENFLRESEERFRQLAENINEVFWLSTPDKSRMIYISPAYETIWGRSCQSLYDSPRDWLDAIHPEDRERVLQAALKEQESGTYDKEYRILRPDGEVRWIRDRAFPVRDAGGAIYRIAGIAENITERRRADEILKISETRYRRLFESAMDGILILAVDDGRIVDANPFLVGMLGYTREEFLGNKLWDIGSFKNILLNKLGFNELRNKGYIRYENLPLETKDGRTMDVEFISNVYREDRGNVIQCNIRDITARKRAEEALSRSREELEETVHERTRELRDANLRLRELDQLKSQFLANMSHELRTPLNAIIGFSQLMHDGKAGGPMSAEHKEYLGDIMDSGKHLLQLINDVLDLSKVEVGRMEVDKSTFAIADVIVEVVQNFAPIVSVKGLKLNRDIPTDLPPITTDRRKLLQILLNLASNAVKFTDRGEVGIRCETAAASVRLSISDTGIGIKQEQLALLFQPFSQIDGGLQKRHEGTGLGLNLSKKLAELIGGDLTVVSEYGKGSTFTLTIPLVG